MTLRKIVTLPDPVLRRKAHTVTKFDKNLQTLIDDMVETMREAPGVGLAAPQIGLSERIIVVEYFERAEDEEKEDAPKKVWAVLNPEIVKPSEETLMGVEGCLSIPGLVGEVVMPRSSIRFAMSGCARISLQAVLSRATTSGGIFGGPERPKKLSSTSLR